MIQDITERLEKQIKENLFELELLEQKRAEKVKSSKEYEEYIKSKEWQETRQRIFKRDNFRCVKCGGSKNLHVHHITYENLGEEKDADLVTLCEKCHNGTHNPTTLDYLLLACANAYTAYDNSTDETEKAKAKLAISVISKAAEDISKPESYPTPDYILLFAYAIRMGEAYDKLDADLKLDESIFPPDVKKIIGSDFASVIDKTLIGSPDKNLNETYAKAYYLKHLLEKIEEKENCLISSLMYAQDEETRLKIQAVLSKTGQTKEKALKLYREC